MCWPKAKATLSTSIKPSTLPVPNIALPLYIYPTAEAWTPLLDAIVAHPNLYFDLIVNPANGPGGTIPDGNYIANVARLNACTNVRLFGYVNVRWGQRDASEVKADILTWTAWAQYSRADIHVDGIFVDEAPSQTGLAPYMEAVWRNARMSFGPKGVLVWTNPGVAVDAAFYEFADMVNTFENTAEYWGHHKHERGTRPGLLTPASLRSKSSAMLHSFTGTRTEMAERVQELRREGYRSILVTDESDYIRLTSMWKEFVLILASLH